MRTSWLPLAFVLGLLCPATAQVTVEVTLPQEQFLPSEAVVAAVRITNRSGQKLRLGGEEDWLTFSMESRDGFVVAKLDDPVVAGAFELESSKVATKRVDLAPCFTLSKPGGYLVTANLRIKAWDRELVSRPKSFDIIHGAKLCEFEFGLPASSASPNSEPEVRKYMLEQANYLKGQIRLYMRLTDASGARTFRVFPIGQMVSFSRPEAQVDKSSNLHVLYANGAHSFNYTSYNPEGDLLLRETYDYVTSRPRLHLNEEGKIAVVGGARRMRAQEASVSLPAVAPIQPPKPGK